MMTDPSVRAGALLGALVRLLADLAIITIAIVLVLDAANVVTLN
jgi:hypothetical protein